MSNKKTIPTISSSEASKMSVSALAVRPNDASRFGQGGLSAKALQEWFDKLPNLVKEKFNDIAEVLASSEAAKYIGTDALGVDNLYDFLLLFGPRGTGVNDKNISDYIETLYAPLGESTEKSVALKDIVSDIARRLVDASAGHVVDAHLDSVTNTLVITFADGTDARVDLSPLAADVGVQGEIDRLKETDADFERRLSNIEEHISDDYFVTDDSVAYEKAVPARACSSAKLLSLGGMTYRDEATNTLRDSKVTEIKSHGANVLPYPYTDTTKTQSGITYTDNGDGTITVDGTTTEITTFRFSTSLSLVHGKTYYFKDTGSGLAIVLAYKDETGATKYASTSLVWNSAYTFVQLYIQVRNTTVSNALVKPMLNEGAAQAPYRPYRAEPIIYPIPAEIQVSKGVGDCADTIDFDAKKSIQKVREVDMGKLNYGYRFNNNRHIFNTNLSAYGIQGQINVTAPINALADDYRAVSVNAPWVDRDMAYTSSSVGNQNVEIVDNRYTNADDFKAAVTGKKLLFALETPIETDISEALENFDNIIEVEGGGSLEFVNEYKNPVPSAVKYLLKEESAV